LRPALTGVCFIPLRRRADRDVYIAEIDECLLMKIGPGEAHPDASVWQFTDSGHCWGIWERRC
jgi:Alpha-amylase C-terminal beta-sheet domain